MEEWCSVRVVNDVSLFRVSIGQLDVPALEDCSSRHIRVVGWYIGSFMNGGARIRGKGGHSEGDGCKLSV